MAFLATDAEVAYTQPIEFGRDVYPIVERLNCRACHNASGVASATRLHFPGDASSRRAVDAFGDSLASLVSPEDPLQSILLLKPTNRVQHTGGELIVPGSDDEAVWVAWIERLADSPLQASNAPVAETTVNRPEPLRRLTHAQYNNTVRDLLGDRTSPANRFPGEDFVNGFLNQAEAQSITPLLAEAYGNAAERLARGAFRFGNRQGLVPCEPTGPDDAKCAERFVREFGRQAFRRPLDAEERSFFTELLLTEAEKTSEFLAGAGLVIETMLQSPDFLFLVEGEGAAATRGYEVAVRLSYLIWNTTPDADLFRAAEAGELVSDQGVERQVLRMLDDPRAGAALDEFAGQWLRFDRALETVKDAVKYKEFTPQVAEAMTEETRRLFRRLVWMDLDFREFFTASYTYPNSFLTALYGLQPPSEPFARVDFPAGYERVGVLGHGTFLAQTGKPDETSPTERGLFVREHFLCQTVPPPPPGINAALPPIAAGAKPLTTREVLLQMHTTDPSCASCHRLVDPIGFGFENFDTIGRLRETLQVVVPPTQQQRKEGMKPQTHELSIDTRGEIAGLPDSEFSSLVEAAEILADSPVCQQCIVKQYFRYAFGRHESLNDQPTLNRVFRAFEDSGFRFRALIMSLASSPAFLRREAESYDVPNDVAP